MHQSSWNMTSPRRDVAFNSQPDVAYVTARIPTDLPTPPDDINCIDMCPPGMDETKWNGRVAAGKAVGILEDRETTVITVERESVYGAALVLPQLARSCRWPLSFTALVIRSYILLLTNVLLQGGLLYMIAKEERLLDKFSGQPRLCDFGAGVTGCPNGPNCVGPGGTVFDPKRHYAWSLWTTRRFVKQSFLNVFPNLQEKIDAAIDPGEYGLESYYLRITSVYVFVLGVWADLSASFELAALLWQVPTARESWLSYEFPDLKEKMARKETWSELELVIFGVAGMPRKWKIFNLCILVLPKLYLWLLTIDIGVVFLMETAKIEDMIINTVALAFILSIDELIFASLMPTMAKHMMENIGDYQVGNVQESTYWSHDALKKHKLDLRWGATTPSLYTRVFPMRLLAIGGITLFFITKYYVESCRRAPDGSLVAKDVHLPASEHLSFPAFLFGPIPGLWPVETEEEPVWQMTYPEGRFDEFRQG